MICRACGTENKGDRRFCRNWGASLAAGCPSGGATNHPEDRYRGTCGTALEAGSDAAMLGATEA